MNVEAELRAARPEPSARFVKAIAARINPRPVLVRTRTRIGVAVVTTACMAAVLGATGGFSFAASSVLGATHSVANLATPRAASSTPLPPRVPGGSAACNVYGHAPTISSFSPDSGGAGRTVVTVQGTNFSGLSQVSSVTVGGASTTPSISSSTTLSFRVPSDADPGPSQISVTNCKGTAISGDDFTVLVEPSITSVSPGDGGFGTPVTITGTGFTGTTRVLIGGLSASFTTNGDGEIDTTVPVKAAIGPGLIEVDNAAGSDTADFTVDTGAPTVTTFLPTSGAAGVSVKVTGKGFFEGQTTAPDPTDITVQFGNGDSTNPDSITKDTELHVTVPAGAETGPITVLTNLGGATSKGTFTFLDAPTITGFSPAFGKVTSTKVTIIGSSFTNATAVQFGSSDAAATATHLVVKDGSISVSVPAGAVTGPLTVVTPRGNVTSGSDFTVIDTPPNPTSASPNSGGYNSPVTINGDSFTGVTGVSFNGKIQKSFTVVSDTEIDTTVPVGATFGAGTGTKAGIVLTNAKGSASIAFTVNDSAPKITKVTSDGHHPITSGKPGDTVVLTGTNLDHVDSVDIGDSSVSTSPSSPTQISLTIPSGVTTTTAPITANDSADETSGSSGPFTVFQAPVVLGVPQFGGPGKKIQITGTNFLSAKTVTFTPDGTGATLTSPAGVPGKDGSLSVTVPIKATLGKSYVITVTLADSLSGGSGTSEVQMVAAPKVTGLVQHGDSVEIDGTGFTGADGGGSNGVFVGKTALNGFTVVSDTKITLTLNGDEPSGTVTVVNPSGFSTSKTVMVGGPTLTSAALKAGTQNVSIKGFGLLGTDNAPTVTINGASATFSFGTGQTQTGITVTGSGLTAHQVVTIVVTTNVGTVTKSVKL